MPVFTYQGVDATGANETGAIEASTEKLAYDTLQSRGIIVFELEQGYGQLDRGIPWYKRDISFRGHNLSLDEQADVADLLATLFGVGLSISQVIRTAALSARRQEVTRHFERVGLRVEDGSSFAEAFEAENKLFSPIFISFLKVSDTANALPQLLRELSGFFRKQNAIRQQIISALIYPAILVCAAIGLLLVVVLYLTPNLAPIFDSVGHEPPATLAALIKIEAVLKNYWLIILSGLTGIILLGATSLQHPIAKAGWRQIRDNIPVLGAMSQLAALARLSQAASLLLRSGHPLAQSLRLATQVVGGSSTHANRFLEAADAIEAGHSASSVFDLDSNIPPTFKEIFRIGEATNRLPSMLLTLADSLFGQIDTQSKRFLTLLTPVITIVLGAGIGTLIYTLMGAILEVNELAF